jgi:hypothetical protein
MCVRLRIDGFERRIAVCPNFCHVVRMHPPHELLDRSLVSGKIEYFHHARIHQHHVAEWIVLPPSELGCVEGKLQAVFACPQVLRRLLVFDRDARPAGEDPGEQSGHDKQQEAHQIFSRVV